MIKIKRTDSNDTCFQNLVRQLDGDLKNFYKDEQTTYQEYNKIDKIKHVIVAYEESEPVGCGAIKEYSENTMEVKRMFVPPTKRGKGIASIILNELESWSNELNCKTCILETLKTKSDAIRLYEKNGYKIIPNFGQYENLENSVCFEKML